MTERQVWRELEREYAEYLAEWQVWQTNRVAEAAVLMRVPVTDFFDRYGHVNGLLMAWCRELHGRPDGPETEPQFPRSRTRKGLQR